MLQTASDRDLPLFLPPGIYVALQPDAAVARAAVRRARRVAHRLWRRRPYAGRRGRRAHRAHRHRRRRRQPLAERQHARRWSTSGACAMPSSTIARSSAAARTASRSNASAGRIENTEISGAADAGIYSVEASGLQITGNSVSDCANGGILVHRWQPADDGTIVSGNRVTRIQARNGGTGQNGNGINVFRANNVMVSNNMRQRLRLLGDPRQQRQQHPDLREQLHRAAARPASIPSSPSKAPSSTPISSTAPPTASRSSISTKAAAWRSARPTSCATSRRKGPYQQDPPGFGVGISVEADCSATGNVVENVPLYGMQIGWGEYMRNVVATGNVIRKAGTGIIISVVEGTGSAVDLRQCHRRRQATAPSSAIAGPSRRRATSRSTAPAATPT